MKRRKQSLILGVAAAVAVAACGSGSEQGTTGQGTTGQGTTEQATAGQVTTPEPVIEEDAATTDPATNEADATGTTESEPAAPVESAPVGTTAESTEATDAPVATDAAPAEPVVGGRLFAADVQPAADFEDNPFPDLVVDDVGKDAQVNLKNILPSDRPVLLWAWAPH